jgi:hypothetical protein
MVEISNAEASANILRFAEEGRLVQSEWHGQDDDGREIACLLGAIHPSVTPPLFDGIPAAEIVPIAGRYGGLVARWGDLAPAAWERVKTAFLIQTVDEAMVAARPVSEGKPYWPAVEAACKQVKAALESGDKKALAAAEAAAEATAWTAAWAAEAA